eukprot:scaffold2753_cov238-Chaetoceros_neogracile.AAC.6
MHVTPNFPMNNSGLMIPPLTPSCWINAVHSLCVRYECFRYLTDRLLAFFNCTYGRKGLGKHDSRCHPEKKDNGTGSSWAPPIDLILGDCCGATSMSDLPAENASDEDLSEKLKAVRVNKIMKECRLMVIQYYKTVAYLSSEVERRLSIVALL